MESEKHNDDPITTTTSTSSWSEELEDLISSGDTSTAISLLESVISKLETQDDDASSHLQSTSLQLASALNELAKLHSSQGFSLKADQLRSRASLVKQRALRTTPSASSRENVYAKKRLEDGGAAVCDDSLRNESLNDGNIREEVKLHGDEGSALDDDDDWEAAADRSPDELLPLESLPEVSKLSLTDNKTQAPKRRGRGTFSYKKDELYSDRMLDNAVMDETEVEDACLSSEETAGVRQSKYGTHHVLVLADFSPSTRTTELEKLLENFRDHGFVIRWVNDTTALAVFRTPAVALEAHKSIQFPFTVRILDGDDVLLNSIPDKDLEPPRQRPKTSARTAQRLIAQGMGLKLPSSSFGSKEFRKQEEARRDRIITRQKLKDDAWGSDSEK